MFRKQRKYSHIGLALAIFILVLALIACRPAETPTPAPAPTATPVAESVTFPGQQGLVKGYMVRPAAQGTLPALIVIHENRGLTEHIKDVTRRFANEGYVTLAVDLLSRVGGRDKFTTDAEATAAIGTLSQEGVVQDLQSALNYLKSLPYVKADRIGVIGYCWGGGNSLLMATRVKELRTAVVYYGPNPANIDDVANISGPMLGIYGEEDTRITVNVPKLAEAMKKYNKSFEYKVYPRAAHAFFNDTGTRYNAEAAADAWQVTLAFLEKNLKS
ncbi:MAG: dienelactone hydrolase family protein [Chloroflexi bacterium]|nr:dienelactone hydrolase family protein [Chloroflexota bacterium]